MRNILIFLSLSSAFLCSTITANSDEKFCENPTSTLEIKLCLAKQLEAVDGELNRVYKNLRAEQDDEANALLKAAQRSWITFRDNECARVADAALGGTMTRVLRLNCHIDLTQVQTKRLATNPFTGEVDANKVN